MPSSRQPRPATDRVCATTARSRGGAMSTNHPANIDVAAALAEAQELYRVRNPKSLAQYQEACAALPGGNTRSAIFVDPFPLTMARGEGAHLWDLDGHEYVDFLSEFTAGLFGHSHPAIRRAIDEALDSGWNLGAQGAAEGRFAAAICDRFPSVELVRFTNSGTEANLMAVAAARALTGRDKILVFSGGYHGGVFYFRGKAEIMEWFDPRRADGFQHAGTFNNNVLTMKAGHVGLTEIYTPERARTLNSFGDGLRERLNATVRRRGLAMQFTGIGSMIGVHMTDRPLRSAADAAQGHTGLLDLFYFDLVARGIWFAKRGMMALSIALDETDADKLIAAVEEFAETRAPLFEGASR